MSLFTVEPSKEQKFNVTKEIRVIKLLDTETSYNSAIKLLPKNYTNEATYILGNQCFQYGKKMRMSVDCVKQNKYFLSGSTIQGMIRRLLIEKKMPKEKLAKMLAVKTKEIECVVAKRGSKKLIAKINLPLIKIYCKTRWQQKQITRDPRGYYSGIVD